MTPREGVEPVAWAVVDRDGCMWKAREVKASMEHERDALNAYVDTGHYKACGPYSLVPLYAHPAATAREEAWKAMGDTVDALLDAVRKFVKKDTPTGLMRLNDAMVAARDALALARSTGGEHA